MLKLRILSILSIITNMSSCFLWALALFICWDELSIISVGLIATLFYISLLFIFGSIMALIKSFKG